MDISSNAVAVRLETPVYGAYHLWVIHNGIYKRLHIMPTREQIMWLALAGPLDKTVPITIELGQWKVDAFEAVVKNIHIFPQTTNLVPRLRVMQNTISRSMKPMHA
jgi:hypothetical protein